MKVQVIDNRTDDGIVYHYVKVGTVLDVSSLPHGGNEVVYITTDDGIQQGIYRKHLMEVHPI